MTRWWLLCALLLLLAGWVPPVSAQDQTDAVADLLSQLTPEERIGQLFITTFSGADAGPEADIGRLIHEQHVGGVVLLAVSKNFVNSSDTPRQVAALSNELQSQALESRVRVPLFIAIDHEGDGFPYSRLTGGMTPIPNPMAIGATWKSENAAAVGEVVGRELAAVGVNLLLGPDVDVLNNPRPEGRGDIGTRTFGGDPWWVAQMGRAYVCGVHAGGAGRVATVAKHFPGHGGSDRLPDREVATVDKSLSELKRIELPPFFAVTDGQEEDPCGITDALMTSHIRYRGLQGNIRQFTAPISFDPEGLSSILSLPEFARWRRTGLMVSDALGVSAVAKHFDPSERSFPHRQIAKEALMAGNDLLIISEFSRPRASALQLANLVDTIAYFREEYDANPLFRQRVDDAVSRILRVKLSLYGGDFSPGTVLVQADAALRVTNQDHALVSKIAREALTLLAPVDGALPEPPRRDEDVVIFTDSQSVSDCLGDECQSYEPLPLTAVQDTILRLYGPAGSGQIDPLRIRSTSFTELKRYLGRRFTGAETPVPDTGSGAPDIGAMLAEAEWVIFAMRNADRDGDSDAVRVYLDNGMDQLYKARLVVLAFNAPYYLDTTEINKLSLYLAAYSKMTPFIEAAVRALFREFVPTGHSPVDVAGINYDLLHQLAPDPARPIPLVQKEPAPDQPAVAPLSGRVQVGPLIDRNGNRVPDGTEVIVEAAYESGGVFVPPERAATLDGLVEVSFLLRQPGVVTISAASGDATSSRGLRLAVAAPPTSTPSPSPAGDLPTAVSTPTQTPASEPTATPSPEPSAAASGQSLPAEGRAAVAAIGDDRVVRLILGLLGMSLAGLVGYLLLGLGNMVPVRRLRLELVCVSGGLAGYIASLFVLGPSSSASVLVTAWAFGGGLAAMTGLWRLTRQA